MHVVHLWPGGVGLHVIVIERGVVTLLKLDLHILGLAHLARALVVLPVGLLTVRVAVPLEEAARTLQFALRLTLGVYILSNIRL